MAQRINPEEFRNLVKFFMARKEESREAMNTIVQWLKEKELILTYKAIDRICAQMENSDMVVEDMLNQIEKAVDLFECEGDIARS